MPLRIQHVGLGCHADEGSQGIKHIYEQEREHDYQEIQGSHTAEVHLHEGRCQARNGNSVGEIRKQAVESGLRIDLVQSGQLAYNTKCPGDQDAPENVALYAFY